MKLSFFYKKTFEERCFQLLIEAYQSSLTDKVIQLDWNENDISSELHRHLKENPLRLKWKVSTNVEAYIPKDIPKAKGFSDKYPRIDFRLTSFISTYEFALKRRYISTGIDNFASKKYENGSLIGYLLEGKIKETVKGVNSLLQKDKRNAEVLKLNSNKLLKTYFESNHSGIRTLKHLIFDFTTI